MQAKASYNSPCGIICVRPTPIRTDIPLLEDAGQHIIAIPGLLVDNIWAIAMPPWGSAGIQQDIRQSKDVLSNIQTNCRQTQNQLESHAYCAMGA